MGTRSKRTYPDLKTYFEESGDNQTAFGARFGRSQSWVSRVVNREIEPNLREAMAISKAARIPLESLIAPACADVERE